MEFLGIKRVFKSLKIVLKHHFLSVLTLYTILLNVRFSLYLGHNHYKKESLEIFQSITGILFKIGISLFESTEKNYLFLPCGRTYITAFCENNNGVYWQKSGDLHVSQYPAHDTICTVVCSKPVLEKKITSMT